MFDSDINQQKLSLPVACFWKFLHQLFKIRNFRSVVFSSLIITISTSVPSLLCNSSQITVKKFQQWNWFLVAFFLCKIAKCICGCIKKKLYYEVCKLFKIEIKKKYQSSKNNNNIWYSNQSVNIYNICKYIFVFMCLVCIKIIVWLL